MKTLRFKPLTTRKGPSDGSTAGRPSGSLPDGYNHPMRTLGIDFGERRIGLAISDPDGRVALPLETVERRSDRKAASAIAAVARREEAERLVIGEPRGLDGVRGAAAVRAVRFGERLAQLTGLPLTVVDEALTSVEALERLRAAGVDVRRHPERVDAVAAQILLQDALDREASVAAARAEAEGSA